MNPSALIFVALAVAWAVYLIPKALEHHEAGERSRSISNFSHRLRVLGRRDAVSRRRTALVTEADHASAGDVAPATTPAQAATPTAPTAPAPAPARPAPLEARRAAVRRATKRRRRVLTLVLLVVAATVAGASLNYIGRIWIAAPVVVLAAWLVTCRLMVRKEHATPRRRAPMAPPAAPPMPAPPTTAPPTAFADDSGSPEGAEPAAVVDSAVGRWDPVDVPLPTYVTKPPAARRTVRTIDLDGTGVWSSGRNEADSALAREAEASRQPEPTQRTNRRTGS